VLLVVRVIHFRFEFYTIRANRFARLYKPCLLKILFRPTRALSVEMPIRIQEIVVPSVNQNHVFIVSLIFHRRLDQV
jgi:hypothetical protein